MWKMLRGEHHQGQRCPLLVQVELEVETLAWFDIGRLADERGDARGVQARDLVAAARVVVGLEAERRDGQVLVLEGGGEVDSGHGDDGEEEEGKGLERRARERRRRVLRGATSFQVVMLARVDVLKLLWAVRF